MKRVILAGIVSSICLIAACGCSSLAATETSSNAESDGSKSELVEDFEKHFEDAVRSDTTRSFLSEIYPNYVIEVIDWDDSTTIVDVSTPPNTKIPDYRLIFKGDAKVFLNGEPAKLSDIRKGDYISVCGTLSTAEISPMEVSDIDLAIIFRE